MVSVGADMMVVEFLTALKVLIVLCSVLVDVRVTVLVPFTMAVVTAYAVNVR